MAGHPGPAANSHPWRDPWPCPMRQVTGLGLDRWQLHSGRPEEVKSGICFNVSASHPCDNGAATRLHATHTVRKCVSVSQATSVCAISMSGWLGWPSYMAAVHATLSLSACLSLSLTYSLTHSLTPLLTHYSVPLYCSDSTWLEYSVAQSSSRLEPTGPWPFICLISSVRPLGVCVCPPSSLYVPPCITSFSLSLSLSLWVCMGRLLHMQQSPLVNCNWQHDKPRLATSLISIRLRSNQLSFTVSLEGALKDKHPP